VYCTIADPRYHQLLRYILLTGQYLPGSDLAIIIGVVDEATLEEDGLGDDDEGAVVDQAPLEEDGLDDDDDDTATEVLDVADVDRTMRDADGSSPMTEVDMMEKAGGDSLGERAGT
jgi:hypothetical protein